MATRLRTDAATGRLVSWLVLLACLVCAACTGCGRLTDLLDDPMRKAYVTPVVHVAGDEATLLDAVERYAASLGWSVDAVDPATERLIAHADERSGGGLERDTWTFEVRRDRIAVRRRVALADASGDNVVTSNLVCRTYSYAVEGMHLEQLAEMVARESRGRRDSALPVVSLR
jgi:hypothetical protein